MTEWIIDSWNLVQRGLIFNSFVYCGIQFHIINENKDDENIIIIEIISFIIYEDTGTLGYFNR